jgi:hypothetical protein
MTEQVQYRVKRGFKYGKKLLKPGDLWQPDNGKWDKLIISNGIVVIERLEAETKAKNGPKSG